MLTCKNPTYPNGLDQPLLLRIHHRPPAFLPDLRSSQCRVQEVQVKVLHSGAFQAPSKILQSALVGAESLELCSEVDGFTRLPGGFCLLSQMLLPLRQEILFSLGWESRD